VPVDEPEIIDVEEEVFTASADVELISEPVADPPIVDAETIGDATSNTEAPEAVKPARRRKAVATPRASRAKTARVAKPRGRKSARTKADADGE
jgi:hypothetical protein